MEYKLVGKRIKQIREKAGLTQEQLANRVDISVTHMSAIERGITFPCGDKLIKILNETNSSADSVFCDVVNASIEENINYIHNKLRVLPKDEQEKIIEFLDFLIEQSKRNI